MRVLLVEDNQDDVELMREGIRESGCEIQLSLAGNGKVALDWLRSNPLPKLVFLDLSLPVLNGLETLQEIQADPALRSLFVVVLTGSLSRRKHEQIKEMGPYPIHRKPLEKLDYLALTSRAISYWESVE